jgi:hypothetical protein
MDNERALTLEEKRTHEILHRLDIEMVSCQSEIAYQVQNILQRGHQILSDFHPNISKEIEENRIHKQNSEHSLTSDLKLEIKDLQITRTFDTNEKSNSSCILYISFLGEYFQTELNRKRANYFSTQLTAYHIQQKIHRMTRELNEIEHELTLNLKTIDERNNQLIQLYLHKQNIEYQSIKDQIDHEQKLSFELKQRNNELNDHLSDHLTLWKTHQHHESELNTKNKVLLEKIHQTQEQIRIEKILQHELSQTFSKLKKNLKQKQNLLSKHQCQQNHLKVNFPPSPPNLIKIS